MKQTIIDAVKTSEGQRVHFSQLVTWDAFATREQVENEPQLSIDENDFVHYVGSNVQSEPSASKVEEAPVSTPVFHAAPPSTVEVTDEERRELIDPKEEFTPIPDEDEPKETVSESASVKEEDNVLEENDTPSNTKEITLSQIKELVAQYNKQIMAKYDKENSNDLQKICDWLMGRYDLSPEAQADGVYAFSAKAHGATETENIVICEEFTTAVENALLNIFENDNDIKVFCLKKTDDETRIRFFVKDVSAVLASLPSKKLESIQLEVFILED